MDRCAVVVGSLWVLWIVVGRRGSLWVVVGPLWVLCLMFNVCLMFLEFHIK